MMMMMMPQQLQVDDARVSDLPAGGYIHEYVARMHARMHDDVDHSFTRMPYVEAT